MSSSNTWGYIAEKPPNAGKRAVGFCAAAFLGLAGLFVSVAPPSSIQANSTEQPNAKHVETTAPAKPSGSFAQTASLTPANE